MEPQPMECRKCHREGLTTNDFHKNGSKKTGYDHRCKQCKARIHKEYYAKNSEKFKGNSSKWARENPDRNSESQRAWKYGITRERQRELWEAQSGKCLICDAGMKYREANLDHAHTTSKVRAFLCKDCNLSIGRLMEDPKRIRRAAAYIHIFNSDHPNPHQVMLNIRDRNFKVVDSAHESIHRLNLSEESSKEF